MASSPQFFGIIPCRYASTRFPGKPLAPILGEPIFWHVFKRASRCTLLDKIVVATDDQRIEKAVQQKGVAVVMTRTDHPSGSDRVLEAAEMLKIPDDAIVVNIQGDEPALHPQMMESLVSVFQEEPEAQAATLAHPITPSEAQNPNIVKVVLDNQAKALYFSRSIIPFPRDNGTPQYLGHIGLYAYRMATLKQFVALGPGKLEMIEKLEQLRLLENGISIQVAITKYRSHGVDSPEDLARVEKILRGEHSV